MSLFRLLAISVGVALLMSQCSDSNENDETPELSRTAIDPPALSESPWDDALGARASLINQVPANTLAYMRIPTLWGLTATPKGNQLSSALSSEANQVELASLQSALGTELANLLPESAKAPAEILMQRLRSPLEVVLLTPETGDPADALVVLGGRMEFSTLELFNVFLLETTGRNEDIVFLPDSQNGSSGAMAMGGLRLHYDYDFSSRRLVAIAGDNTDKARLEEVLAWTDSSANSPVKVMEQRIDSSGHGFYTWIDTETMGPMAAAMVPPETMNELGGSDFYGLESIAFGVGVAGGKGRLSIIASGSDSVVFDSTLPTLPAPDFRVRGDPSIAGMVRIPNRQWLDAVMAQFVEIEDLPRDPNGGDQPDFNIFWSEFSAELGFDVENMLAALPGYLSFVEDASGRYAAYSPENPDSVDNFLLDMASAGILNVDALSIDGLSIRELSYEPPGLIEEAPDIARRIRSRIYMSRDGDHFFFAQAPQILVSRNRIAGSLPLSDYLKSVLPDANRSVFSLISKTENVTSKNYYNYLTILQLLGDLAGHEVDIAAFPVAEDLQLASESEYAVQLSFTDNEFSLQLAYESHPFEFMAGSSGMATMAVAGVAAAVALPAYQNYSNRAAFSELVLSVTPRKVAVENALNSGNITSLEQLDGSAFGIPADTPVSVTSHGASVVDGTITMTWMQDGSIMAGATYILYLFDAGGTLQWAEDGSCLDQGFC